MLLKACGRCNKLIPYGGSYCSICLPIVQGEREERKREAKRRGDRAYNATRDPKYSQFYNSIDWRVLSAKRLQDDRYRCVWCGKIATEVDHIIEIQTDEGWTKRLDYDNTRSMCHDCHNKRHKRFMPKKNKGNSPENLRRVGVD